MSPEQHERPDTPRWLPDTAPTLAARFWHCLLLWPRLWRPGRLWRSVSPQTPVSLSALAMFLLVLALLRVVMGVAGAGDDLAFQLRQPELPGFEITAGELASEIARPRFASRLRDDGLLDPAWLGAPLVGHTAFMLLLLALGKDRKRVGVTAAHVLRAWVYGLAWLGAVFSFCALAGAFDSYTSARLVYSGFDHPSDTLDSLSRGLIRATESYVLLVIIAAWILLWWRSAIVTAWKIPRGNAGWLLIGILSIVAGVITVVLTHKLQTIQLFALE